ncbi:MAG: DUF4956 domain-containing protein [Oligoflexus sp.]|nr:DUF4956 domain-containing protein [Oligoflexus sp.]
MIDTMLENLSDGFDASNMTHGDVPSFVLCMVVSMAFGILLYLLYTFYFRDNEPQDSSLARSLVLLTPALTATFWIIQSSVILSLGLLGSLSFVRYRTPVKRSEDVCFIVIALAVAVSCSTMNFIIAAVLLTMLFGFTLVRNLWGMSSRGKDRLAIVTFNSKKDIAIGELRGHFARLGISAEFVSSRTYDGITSFVFNAPKMSKEKHDAISETLAQIDREASFNIFYPNDRLGA